MTSLKARLIAAASLAVLIGTLLVLFAMHERAIGAAGVQAKWGAAKAEQAAVVAKAQAAATRRVMDLQHQFDALSAKYETATHVHAPQIADTVAAGLADGTVRLRDDQRAACAGTVPATTARSRAADAAATQALADRTAAAIRIIRIGDAADARERQLGEQVIALQGVLRAERMP